LDKALLTRLVRALPARSMEQIDAGLRLVLAL
jgi:hypothetical protein